LSKNVLKLLEEALAAQGRGDTDLALQRFQEVLKKDSKNVAALYSIGTIQANQGADAKANDYFARATQLRPSFAEAWLARSVLAMRAGDFDHAHKHLDKAKGLNPSPPGLAEHQQQLATVESLVKGADGSLAAPGVNVAQLMRALAFQAQGDHSSAIALLQALLEQEGPSYTALYSLGVSQHALGLTEATLQSFQAAIQAEPSRHEAYQALGSVYNGLGLLEKALEFNNKALEINPSYKEAFVNKSVVLVHLHRHIEAIETLQKALEQFPQDQGLWNNYGAVLSDFKLHQNAADAYKNLLALNPNYEFGVGLYAFANMHACNWQDYEESKEKIVQAARAGKPVANPFALMSFTDDAGLHLATAKVFGEKRFPPAKEPLWKGERYTNRRKKVAFLSSDFREHPVGYLLIGLIEGLNQTEFETIGVSFGINDNSNLHKRYRCAFSHFWDCRNKPAKEVADLLRTFQVDVVIDLSGYTAGSRLDILAMRPAPVQATYLGYPGTLGLTYVDYLIGDSVTVPHDLEQSYSEKIIRLPHSYLPRDTRMLENGEWRSEYSREFFGLPKDKRVLCSFNHDYKINPPMFDVWMRLLHDHPDTILWLMSLHDDARTNLKNQASLRDVDPNRLIFANRVPSSCDHLARYEMVDVCLDTFPYNGHTTTSDALTMGAPVVSMKGQGFASRVASGLLHDFQKDELSVGSYESYYRVASRRLVDQPLNVLARGRAYPVSMENQIGAFETALRELAG
jgi:protein O-GlcNAc transferase